MLKFTCGKWLFLTVGDILGEGGVLAVSGTVYWKF